MADEDEGGPPSSTLLRQSIDPLRRKVQKRVDRARHNPMVDMTIDVTAVWSAEFELSLRTKAAMVYIASTSDDPFEDVMTDPAVGQVGQARLLEWKDQDGWDAQRKEMQRRVADNIRLKLTDKLTEMKVRDLEDLGRVIQGSKELLRETPPKSWEGVAKVLLAATDQRARIMEAVMERVVPKEDQQQKSLMALGSAAVERKGVGTDRLKEAADQLLEAEMDSDDEERE